MNDFVQPKFVNLESDPATGVRQVLTVSNTGIRRMFLADLGDCRNGSLASANAIKDGNQAEPFGWVVLSALNKCVQKKDTVRVDSPALCSTSK